MTKSWLPLEANPDVLTEYSRKLGLPENLAFHDILGVEDWAIDMVPPPLQAILLLFPISAASEDERRTTKWTPSESIYFMKQSIGNACGTVAVLHVMLTLTKQGDIVPPLDSYTCRMLDLTQSLTPEARGTWLENDTEIESVHLATETLGQSAAPSDTGAEVDTHFIAFVIGADGRSIYELDGRREGPVLRGVCEGRSDFGSTVLSVIKSEFMDRNPNDIRFSILALAPSE